MSPRELAATFPRLHERQERMEAENLLAAGLGEELGVTSREWPDGLWSVRTTSAPDHEAGNQLTGVTPAHLDVLEERIAWHVSSGCGVHLRWPGPAVEHSASERLATLGLVAHELEAWMARPLAELNVESTPHDIALVDDEPSLEHWLSAFTAGWSIDDDAKARVARAAMGAWPGPPEWRRYVARVDGEPAGEALLSVFGEVAYLAEAATVPRFRRRGIQRALIARRIADACAAGATVAFSAVRYGDGSWANMRRMGLREAFLTLSYRRPAATR